MDVPRIRISMQTALKKGHKLICHVDKMCIVYDLLINYGHLKYQHDVADVHNGDKLREAEGRSEPSLRVDLL